MYSASCVNRINASELCTTAEKAWLGIFISISLKKNKSSGTESQVLRAVPNIVEFSLKSQAIAALQMGSSSHEKL